jgi:hypothetical protein
MRHPFHFCIGNETGRWCGKGFNESFADFGQIRQYRHPQALNSYRKALVRDAAGRLCGALSMRWKFATTR